MSRYLADTHALLWHTLEPERLGQHARRILDDASIPVWFSVASIWEIGIKVSLGKLKLDASVEAFAHSQLRNAFQMLPVQLSHIAHVAGIPLHHRDPFDRMLIAQAEVEGLQIITMDASFAQYDVRCVW